MQKMIIGRAYPLTLVTHGALPIPITLILHDLFVLWLYYLVFHTFYANSFFIFFGFRVRIATVSLPPPQAAPERRTFASLGVSPDLLAALTAAGITGPSPIQALVIPAQAAPLGLDLDPERVVTTSVPPGRGGLRGSDIAALYHPNDARFGGSIGV